MLPILKMHVVHKGEPPAVASLLLTVARFSESVPVLQFTQTIVSVQSRAEGQWRGEGETRSRVILRSVGLLEDQHQLALCHRA